MRIRLKSDSTNRTSLIAFCINRTSQLRQIEATSETRRILIYLAKIASFRPYFTIDKVHTCISTSVFYLKILFLPQNDVKLVSLTSRRHIHLGAPARCLWFSHDDNAKWNSDSESRNRDLVRRSTLLRLLRDHFEVFHRRRRVHRSSRVS